MDSDNGMFSIFRSRQCFDSGKGAGIWLARPALSPHLRSFTAIGTDVNISPAMKHFGPERRIFIILPDLPERFPFQVPHPVPGILVKAAGYHQSVPGDYRGMP